MTGRQYTIVEIVLNLFIFFIIHAVEVSVRLKGKSHILACQLVYAVQLVLSRGHGEDGHQHIRASAAVAA